MKKRKALCSVLAACFLMVFSIGCSGSAGTSEQASAEQGTTGVQTESEGESQSQGQTKVAIILKALANEHWVAMEEAFKKQSEKLGIVADLYAVDSESDMQGQQQKFEDALTKDYAGIAFAPISPVNLISTVVKANSQGIIVVNFDEKVDTTELKNAGGYLAAFVTTDNEKIGEKAGQFIVENLGDTGGKVLIIEGIAGNATSNARKSGVEKILTANDSIQIVGSQPGDWDRTKAMDVATNMMQSNPDLSAIYCCNDTMALGALEAVRNAGKSEQIIVVGTDGVSEAVQSVQDGGLAATVAQDPEGFAIMTLDVLLEAIREGKTGEGSDTRDIYVDSKLIAK